MDKYQSPMDGLPDEYMRLVGIVAAHWEWVEHVLELSIAEIMEHPFNRVALLTNEVGFHKKCDLVLLYARVFEKNDPEIWKRFTSAVRGLRDAYTERNKYVHAKWKRDKTTKAWGRTEVSIKGGKLGLVDGIVTKDELEAAAKTIWTAGENYLNLCQEFGVLTASPVKSEPSLAPDSKPKE